MATLVSPTVGAAVKLRRLNRLNRWTVGAVFAAILVFIPIGSVLFLSLGDSGDVWPHLIGTALPEYVGTTLLLLLGVGVSVFLTGVTTAWLVTMCRFPGRRTFEWLLLFPLAIPAYVMAYAYTDLLEYAGPVQSSLRALFGWQSAREYFFPPVRSLGGAIMFMVLVLYPYVYLLARSAFLEQSVSVLEVSRVLGKGPWQTFKTVSFPAARPAIVVGVSLALMETLNDYGTVDFFAVYTLTAGLIDVWLGRGSLAGGAQIATSMLVFVILLIVLERMSRRHQKVYQQASSRFKTLPTYSLKGWRSALALGLCALPVIAGFVVPVL
ncbi:MAG: ABC transporter permease subunit, partial [Gammaproteobacteria bacterium]